MSPTAFSLPNFSNSIPRPIFDICAIDDVEIVVTRDTHTISSFIKDRFAANHFVAMDVEYEEGLTCTRLVDGIDTNMSTVDIAALQFCSDAKVLIIPIHNNVCPQPIKDLLQDSSMWKYGVGITGDVSLLVKYMNVVPLSCFDIGLLAKTVHGDAWYAHDPKAPFAALLSLQLLCDAYLQRKLVKPDWCSLYATKRNKPVGVPFDPLWKEHSNQFWLPSELQKHYMAIDVLVPDHILKNSLIGSISVHSDAFKRILFDAKLERTYSLKLSRESLTRFLSVTSSALFEAMRAPPIESEKEVVFDIRDGDVKGLTEALLGQLLEFQSRSLSVSASQPQNRTLAADDNHGANIERTYSLKLSRESLARFSSVTYSALFEAMRAPRIQSDKDVVFDIRDDDVEGLTEALLGQLLEYNLPVATSQPENRTFGVGDDHGLPFHVAVLSDRSVDGKREYDLYYKNSRVRSRVYFVSAGTVHRWKPADLKWYFVS